ncbi:MAG: carboxynorspermidine decarboxylase [Spirochaeta sp.]|jgi:carboxynorspermidine decarboxylase|nr:carboxynorspermidine decarboxylase [Spirochaeta sp.]
MTPLTRTGRADPDSPGDFRPFSGFDPRQVPSPAFVVDRTAVKRNLDVLRETADHAGARVLLALKAFALPAVFDLIGAHLDGACASGVYEAQLAREELGRYGGPAWQVHTFAPAYTPTDLAYLCSVSDHLSFNSLTQYARLVRDSGATTLPHTPAYGLRINPECSLTEPAIYDPCAPYSRLGITRDELNRQITEIAGATTPDAVGHALRGISGLHFHTLCENDSHALEKTLAAVGRRFGDLLARPEITWLNIGGGHHITKADYDRDHLVQLIRETRRRYGVEVILEPGEAVAIHTGILVSTVVDLHRNARDLAILDTSATAHMPDTLEMPYRPNIWDSSLPGAAPHLYRLGGQTCLAGDVIGDYAFSRPLAIGDRLVFDDMSHYTMVKTSSFNGMPLPTIAVWDSESRQIVDARAPAYSDFRNRLGGLLR